uniref:Cilia-and flagella-associated protein 96 n=1 Tax=Timema californicum TaxID=61474 RepID=A0A7R9J0I1_TIMCA|nr:unnamed protein product [Timema californicum]
MGTKLLSAANMVKAFDPNIGVNFGKRDMERMGIFVEMSYLIGKGHVEPYTGHIRQVATGRQMFPGYPKSKSATQDGYFAEKFLRVFEKEALTNMFQRHLIESIASSKKNIGSTAFRPAGATKKHSCPGDYHGTFIKNMPGKVQTVLSSNSTKDALEYEPRQL